MYNLPFGSTNSLSRQVAVPGYELVYGKNRWATLLSIILQIPKILISIKRENRWLKQLVSTQPLDLVISDNRYGLYNSKVRSILITHQVAIANPFGKTSGRILKLFTKDLSVISVNAGCPIFHGRRGEGGPWCRHFRPLARHGQCHNRHPIAAHQDTQNRPSHGKPSLERKLGEAGAFLYCRSPGFQCKQNGPKEGLSPAGPKKTPKGGTVYPGYREEARAGGNLDWLRVSELEQ